MASLITKTLNVTRIETHETRGTKRYIIWVATQHGTTRAYHELPASLTGTRLERDFPLDADINETITAKIDCRIRVTKTGTTSTSYIDSYTKESK